jgi:serine/threonine protein kinase
VRLNRDVALKTLPAVAPDAIARLQGEARAMASLNHHAIATIYGLDVWRDVPVLVCEYFANGTLAHRLAATGRLVPADVIRLGVALAQGLDCMHASGLVHGDIKPANVGFTARHDPKLLDFGVSRLVATGAPGVRRHALAGTLAYLSPDALRGHAPSAAFDLWALAVVLLECVVGRNPLARDTEAATRRAILDADPAALARPARAIHPLLGAWLERALGNAPDRFDSAGAMLQALERVSLDTASGDHRE